MRNLDLDSYSYESNKYENLVQLTLKSRAHEFFNYRKQIFKALLNLEVLNLHYYKFTDVYINEIALIPSKRFRKLKLKTSGITQKYLEQLVDALKQHDQPIAL